MVRRRATAAQLMTAIGSYTLHSESRINSKRSSQLPDISEEKVRQVWASSFYRNFRVGLNVNAYTGFSGYPQVVLMKLRLQYLAVTGAFIFFLALAFERPAYGYTDPGSALLVFQSLSAVITGSLFYFRKRLRKLISTVKRPEKRSE